MRKKIDRSQRKLRSRDKFFQDLAAESGYMDEESVKSVYYAMIRMLSRDLRLEGYTQMPDWGHFSLILHQARKALNVNTGHLHMLPTKKVVKYEVDYKLKGYFNKL